MPRPKKMPRVDVRGLIRDYRNDPLKPGEDLLLVKLWQDGAITEKQLKDALWAADEAEFAREWSRRNASDNRKRPGEAAREDEDEKEGDGDGSADE